MAERVDPQEAERFMIASGLKPLEPFTKSLAKWKCIHLECGEVVYAVYNQVRKGQGGCKPCGIKKRAITQRKPLDSALKTMLDSGVKPVEEYPGIKKPWKCECLNCGKIVSPTLGAVQSGQGACKYCSKRYVDEADAIEIMQRGGFQPIDAYGGAGSPWKSKCLACGQISSPTFANVQRGSKCLNCSNKQKGISQRTPESVAIQLMVDAGFTPLEKYVSQKMPWKSKCMKCKRTVTPTLGNVINGNSGCGFCSGKVVDPEDAVALMLEAGLSPLEPYSFSDSPWKCRHLVCGREVSPSYSSIRRGQGGCRKCGYEIGAKKNLYPEAEAIEIMKSANFRPLEAFTKSSDPWKCECMKCKKNVYPTLSNVKSGNSRCIYCSKMKVDPEDAVALMQKAGYEPLQPYVDSKSKWECRHIKCGKVIKTQYNTIQSGKGGCVHCAEYGINFDEPAYFYIMEHLEFGSLKVGISNNEARPNRIESHRKAGWILLKQFQFDSGQVADYVETKILFWLRNTKKLGIHLSKEMMKQGGYSETVDSQEIDYKQIQRQVEKIVEDMKI
jgi:hypothetical protein